MYIYIFAIQTSTLVWIDGVIARSIPYSFTKPRTALFAMCTWEDIKKYRYKFTFSSKRLYVEEMFVLWVGGAHKFSASAVRFQLPFYGRRLRYWQRLDPLYCFLQLGTNFKAKPIFQNLAMGESIVSAPLSISDRRPAFFGGNPSVFF